MKKNNSKDRVKNEIGKIVSLPVVLRKVSKTGEVSVTIKEMKLTFTKKEGFPGLKIIPDN